MGRKSKARAVSGFSLIETDIKQVYLSEVSVWSNGGSYIPLPTVSGNRGKRAYVVVVND